MKTIDIKEFTDNFMVISSNLTHAEIRMLYLLITEPDVIKLSQQKLADKIETHRRTINIGLKKLVKYTYLRDFHTRDDETLNSDKNITINQIEYGELNNDSQNVITKATESNYNELLSDFLLLKNNDLLCKLFEEFEGRYSEILLGIRNSLPEDINKLAEKYGFIDELRIIEISNKALAELKKEKGHEERGYLDLITKYSMNKNKYVRKKIAREFIIYYPFLVEKFIRMIKPAVTEDISELVENIVKELYGIELSQLLRWSIAN